MIEHRLRIEAGPPLRGEFRPPGDKSITHRALLLALLAAGTSRITSANPGTDCAATARAVEALGGAITRREGGWEVVGCGGALAEPEGVLDCGNSGTSLRLLSGVVAAYPVFAVLAGDASLHRRPVGRVIEPLRAMGATLSARDDDRLPPLAIRGAALRGIDWTLPIPSAQVASCVLLAGLGASGVTRVTLPGPARDHTERMLAGLGVPIEVEPAGEGRRVAVRGGSALPAFEWRVPGDFSAAAFFLAAAAARPGARVTARGVSLNPTRAAFLDVLAAMGATIERDRERLEAGEPVGDVSVTGPDRLRAFDVPAAWLPRMIDEVPAWAVAAAAAEGTSRVRGAAELRVKESDRLAFLARNLGALGIETREHRDGIDVTGGTPRAGSIATGGDHRIAMAFAVLGACVSGGLDIDDAASLSTSDPDFLATFGALGGRLGSARAEVAP